MGHFDRFSPEVAGYTALDIMLADIAVRIQLSPTDYQLAIDHYQAIAEWIDNKDSPLFGLVELFYAQGGFSIGATIARHSTDDEFDIDAMAQLALKASVDPEAALAILHAAIKRGPDTRYHEKVDRKTRCSTVNYDKMHLDVTPAVRIAGNDRASLIFHSKPEDPNEQKRSLHANPYGFGQWFIANTPADDAFGRFFEKRSLDFARARAYRLMIEQKAETVPVPDQLPAYRKSLAVISLQLEKRWRNLGYDRRHAQLRRPPSVLLSYYNARHANRTRTISEELLHQISAQVAILEAADRDRRLICEFNPACEYRRDELTDRWPGTLYDQRVFLDELVDFATKIHRLRQGVRLDVMQAILADLFGETPAAEAIKAQTSQRVADRASGVSLYIPRSASVPPLGSLAVPAIARAAPGNTYFGD
ncbi:MAG TPA: nucleotidyltransferase [Hyphomicrobium sp.]|nr:nucleotidyltransferase [Hyphomicrobium sp.]